MKPFSRHLNSKTTLFFLLLALSITIRLLLWFIFDPIIGQDTSGYERLANCFITGDFSAYFGDRTPVFPLVIAMNNMSYNGVVLTQFLMGVAISLILYYILLLLDIKPWIAFIGGASYSLHIPLVMREFYIATETTSVFFTTLLFLFIVLYHVQEGRKFLMVLFIGISISLLTLTRPASLVLIPFLPVLLIIFDRMNLRSWQIGRMIKLVLVYSVPVILFVGGWSQFNNVKYDKFTLTTFKGHSLINSAGNLMVHAPDKYEPYKSIYLANHEKKLREEGKFYNAVHLCTDTLMETMDLEFWELSEKWEEIAWTIIKENPAAYFTESVKSFIRIWKPMGFYKDSGKAFLRIRQAEQLAVIIASFLFFAIPIILIVFRKKKYYSLKEIFIISYVFFISLGISAISALVEYGDPRFSIPYLPLILITVIFFYSRLIQVFMPIIRKQEE